MTGPAGDAARERSTEEAPRARVVLIDEWLAVIEKPPGLVVHPAPSHHGETLVDQLTEVLAGGEDPTRPGIVHRLDRYTSGLMVVARTDDAHRSLAAAVKARNIERRYLALADGRIASRTGTIDAPIGRESRKRHRMAVSGAGAKEARTHFEVKELLRGETFLEARLETGRTHQIRTHFKEIGHPLVGDITYGGPVRFGLDRQFLHAYRLAFDHPVTGERIDQRCELWPDLAQALAQAREAARAS